MNFDLKQRKRKHSVERDFLNSATLKRVTLNLPYSDAVHWGIKEGRLECNLQWNSLLVGFTGLFGVLVGQSHKNNDKDGPWNKESSHEIFTRPHCVVMCLPVRYNDLIGKIWNKLMKTNATSLQQIRPL